MSLAGLARRDQKGAAATEFALAVPVLVLFIVGAVQLGMLFFASADMRNAVGAGARHASIYPSPTDQAVIDRIRTQVAGLDARYVSGPNIRRSTDANGNAYADISMSYSVPLNFIFFETPPVTLTETRRVFTQPEGP